MSDVELTPDEIGKIIVEATRANEIGWQGHSTITELFGRALLQTRRQLEQIADIAEGSTSVNSLAHIARIARHAQAAMKEQK